MIDGGWRKGLSPRQTEVCELVAQGLDSRAIAVRLGGLSRRTIEDYRSQAMHKLGVNNAIMLTRKVLGIDP